MRWVKRLPKWADSVVEYTGLTFLAGMVLIIVWQVFSRQILDTTPPWSGETALILMTWTAFLGMAVGFRERSHVAIGFVVESLPRPAQHGTRLLVHALTFLFGFYLLVQGATLTMAARYATLPSTGLPRSSLYVILPISGLMICIYSALQAAGIPTQKYGNGTAEGAAPNGPQRRPAEES